MSSIDDLPNFSDVQAAAKRLRGMARRTPLLESDLLNERVGGRLFLKAEPLQRTGSFKFRGAYNAISRVIERGGKRPVVAFSSGNHAQGVALAAKLLGVGATIVMPSDAPAIKRRNTEAYGAELRLYDR
ncbi:MAG: pyridoxal-phosphate dependent enzyme, partial [Pseudomonadota bacterium]